MVINEYLKCSICSATIRLRIQVGYRDIPFMFFCPDCKTEIKGEIVFENNGSKKTWMKNVERYTPEGNTAKYVQEISSEFLQKKISLDEWIPEKMISPFLRNFMQGEEKIKIIIDVQRYYNFYSVYKNELKIIQELYLNNKYELLRNKIKNKELKLVQELKKTFPKEWKLKFENQLDFLMIIHQARNLLITNLLNLASKQNILNSPKVIRDDLFPILDKIKPLIKLFGDSDRFTQFNKRMDEVTYNYMEILPFLLPVISSVDYYREELLSKEYIISYEPLFELTNLYQQMFELFCDGIDLVIGINNAFNRGNYEKFCKYFRNVSSFNEIINSYNSKYKKYTELLMVFDKFSPPFIGIIHNKIRNAEGHFNRQVEPDTHEIVFKDLHMGNNTEIRIDYLEFALSVVQLYSALDFLFEYHYQLNKSYFQLFKGLRCNYDHP
jgi:hypothetical protein